MTHATDDNDDFDNNPVPKHKTMDDKFIVFRRDVWQEWLTLVGSSSSTGKFSGPPPVYDAVVLRKQDVFTAPTLEVYRNSALLAHDLLPPDRFERRRLREIADYMHVQAEDAYGMNRQLPD